MASGPRPPAGQKIVLASQNRASHSSQRENSPRATTDGTRQLETHDKRRSLYTGQATRTDARPTTSRGAMSDTSGCPENAQASLTAALCSRKKILAKSGKITAGETQTSPLSNEGNDPQRSERNTSMEQNPSLAAHHFKHALDPARTKHSHTTGSQPPVDDRCGEPQGTNPGATWRFTEEQNKTYTNDVFANSDARLIHT